RPSARSIEIDQATTPATTIPAGTLIRNSQCHEYRSVIKPPTVGPSVGASIAITPAIIVARTRWRPSTNIRNTVENTSGIRNPPKNPWTTRAATSHQNALAAAHTALDAAKPRTHTAKAPRVDKARVIQPVSGIATISAER